MTNKSDIIIIPKDFSSKNLAVEIYSRTKPFFVGPYESFIGAPDKENLELVLKLVKEYADMKLYFTREIAENILRGVKPQGISNGSNYNPAYSSISLAAVGPSYETLHEKIESFANKDRGVASARARKALGNHIMTPHPTVREPIGNISPTWSYRFPWKTDTHPGFPNSMPRDIVLGIYEKLE